MQEEGGDIISTSRLTAPGARVWHSFRLCWTIPGFSEVTGIVSLGSFSEAQCRRTDIRSLHVDLVSATCRDPLLAPSVCVDSRRFHQERWLRPGTDGFLSSLMTSLSLVPLAQLPRDSRQDDAEWKGRARGVFLKLGQKHPVSLRWGRHHGWACPVFSFMMGNSSFPSLRVVPTLYRQTPSMLFLRLLTRTQGFVPDSVSAASVWVSRSGTDFTPQGESQVPRHAALPGRPWPPRSVPARHPEGPETPTVST